MSPQRTYLDRPSGQALYGLRRLRREELPVNPELWRQEQRERREYEPHADEPSQSKPAEEEPPAHEKPPIRQTPQ